MNTPSLLFVCTGNATRSVIAEALVRRDRPDWQVTSAGTFAIPGLGSSHRTRAALAAIGVDAPGHRSRLLTEEHCAAADLVVTFEVDHVRFIRRRHPVAAARTATLRRLAAVPEDSGSWRLPGSLADEPLEPWMEIDDPAGGDVDDFVACAHSIDTDVRRLLLLVDRLEHGGSGAPD